MKKPVIVGIVVIVLAVASYITIRVKTSRRLSPSQTASYHYKDLDVKVDYCSPFKRGRLIFGEAKDSALLPYGKYWRLGANEATEITFSKNVFFGDKPIPAGSYRLYAVPNAASWDVSLNSELGKWGYDEPNHALDVLTIEAPVTATHTQAESFSISFREYPPGLSMDLVWDTTRVSVPIALQ